MTLPATTPGHSNGPSGAVNIIVLCHGGPIAMPADARYVLEHARGAHGFYGASSLERLPTDQAVISQTREFKAM
jgi:predicted TIM-barrel enzyme